MQIDSIAAKALALSNQVSARMKHIGIKYHFVLAAIASGIIHLVDLKSDNNPAGMLTKIIYLPILLNSSQTT